MKTKTLIGIAVASTFGWAASTYAGSSHEVITPLSVSEAGEVLPSTASGGFGSSELMAATASTSTLDETLTLANEGVYSDFYVVSAPAIVESWDYYVIDTTLPSTDQ